MCQKSTEFGKFWWITELLFLFSTLELQLITHNKDLKVHFANFGEISTISAKFIWTYQQQNDKKMDFFNEILQTSAFFSKIFQISFFLIFTYHLKCLWCKFEVIYIDIWKVIDEYLNTTIYHKLLKVFPSGL